MNHPDWPDSLAVVLLVLPLPIQTNLVSHSGIIPQRPPRHRARSSTRSTVARRVEHPADRRPQRTRTYRASREEQRSLGHVQQALA